jgi:hypothetical protein
MLKQQGVAVDEAITWPLLRLCYNRLMEAWHPGGYPPKKLGAAVREPFPPALHFLPVLLPSTACCKHHGPCGSLGIA